MLWDIWWIREKILIPCFNHKWQSGVFCMTTISPISCPQLHNSVLWRAFSAPLCLRLSTFLSNRYSSKTTCQIFCMTIVFPISCPHLHNSILWWAFFYHHPDPSTFASNCHFSKTTCQIFFKLYTTMKDKMLPSSVGRFFDFLKIQILKFSYFESLLLQEFSLDSL